MDRLPVFEKGIVDSSVDPASFWSNATAGKTFFTGNKTGLDSIGHTEEPRVVDEDEFMKTNNELVNRDNEADQQNYGENEDAGDNEDPNNYYGENGEYYGGGELGEYDYDPGDDFGYDEDDDDTDDYDDEDEDDEDFFVGSRPSSGRRTPDDASNPLGLDATGSVAGSNVVVPFQESNEKQVEDR